MLSFVFMKVAFAYFIHIDHIVIFDIFLGDLVHDMT